MAAPVALEHELAVGDIEPLPRHVRRDAAAAAELDERAALPCRRLRRPRLDGVARQRAARIRHDEIQVEIDDAAEPPARLARPEWAVEGEQVRDRIADGEAAGRTVEGGREADGLVTVREHDRRTAASVPERLLQRFDETRALGGAQPQAVLDDGQDAVDERRGLELFERHGAGRPERPHEPRLQESRPHVGPRERRRRRQGEGEDGTRAVVRREQRIRGALGRVTLDDSAAAAAVGHADLGEQQLQVVVQLRHGADGRARRLHRTALVDGDCRQDAVDALDARLVHAIEELPGVRREALDVAPLPFGVEHIEGEARLPGAGHSRDDGERAQGNADVDPAQVVLAGGEDVDRGLGHVDVAAHGVRGLGDCRTREYTGLGRSRKAAHRAGATTTVRPDGARRPGALGAAP